MHCDPVTPFQTDDRCSTGRRLSVRSLPELMQYNHPLRHNNVRSHLLVSINHRRMKTWTNAKPEVVIIGAGVIGLSTALKLLEKGARVTLLEREHVGCESSWAGAGILSPIYPWDYSEAVTRLTQYSAKQFPQWVQALQQATGIDPEYHQSGMHSLPPINIARVIQWCARHNVVARRLPFSIIELNGGGETANRARNTTHDENQAEAVFLPDIAQIRNPRLLRALQRRVIQLGGQIIENCSAHDWVVSNHTVRSVHTSRGSITADYYIVAAGAWSKTVLGRHALKLDIHPVKGQMLLFKFDTPPLATIVVRDGLYLIPRRDGHVLAGSSLEDSGFDKRITATVRQRLLTFAQTILPQLRDMPVLRHWSGLRPGSPLNIPTIGKHPELSNLYLNSGHFRYGVTMAPASAEILVNEIVQATQPIDISPYRSGW